MGYRLISFRGKRSDSREFEEALEMAKEGLSRVCELAEEMHDRYGERRRDYGRRGEDWDEMEDFGERRRRDSRGRYM